MFYAYNYETKKLIVTDNLKSMAYDLKIPTSTLYACMIRTKMIWNKITFSYDELTEEEIEKRKPKTFICKNIITNEIKEFYTAIECLDYINSKLPNNNKIFLGSIYNSIKFGHIIRKQYLMI